MIESAGAPGHRIMAVFARLSGRNMGIGFTDRIHIVVAAFASAGNAAVVESDTGPGLIRDMAVVTCSRGLDMIR